MRLLLIAVCLLAGTWIHAATLSVNVAGQSGSDFSTRLNTTDVQVALFVLQSSGGDVEVNGVTLHFSNEVAAAAAFTQVRMFFDADGNSTFDPSEELDAPQTPNGTDDFLTFNDTFTVPSGAIRLLQVRATVGNNVASFGEAFSFRIDAEASIDLEDPVNDSVSGSFPVTDKTITIRSSENQLVPGTGNPTEPREVFFGDTAVGALHFIISSLLPTSPGQLDGIQLDSITISITFQSSAQTDAITRLTLWQDNGNSVFEPDEGEVLIQERTPADLTKWTVSGSVVSVTFDGTPIAVLQGITSGSARTFWVGIDFDNDIEAVCEVSVNRTGILGTLGADADFFISPPTAISGDVISVGARPPRPMPAEAQGEGGCSSHEGPGRWWLVPVLMLAAVLLRRASPTVLRRQTCT
jgi:hypothetical protein